MDEKTYIATYESHAGMTTTSVEIVAKSYSSAYAIAKMRMPEGCFLRGVVLA